jgi:hypothetical protein
MKFLMLGSPAIDAAFEAAKAGAADSLQSIIVKWPSPPLDTHFQELIDWVTGESPPLAGLLTAHAVLALTGADPSSSAAQPAYALGWIVEIFHMSTAILHDLTHKATIRQGKPCWHLLNSNGYACISDAYFLENAVHILAVKYFSDPEVRRGLKSLFQKATIFTGLCQIPVSPDHDVDPAIMWLPIATALCVSQTVTQEAWSSDQIRTVLFEVSKLLKSIREYLDFRGPGEAITNGAETWLLSKALELGSEAQKQILTEANGKVDGIEKVNQVYGELGVDGLAREFQDTFLGELKGKLEVLAGVLSPAVVDLIIKLLTRPSED